MKYIRTKDGVYEIERYFEPRDYYWVKQDCDQPIGSDEIIKEADTIEELFDGFVFIDTSANEIHVSKDMEQAKNDGMFILGCSLFKETLRGFIRTDKGLIYVAQLNDKGEWGLL